MAKTTTPQNAAERREVCDSLSGAGQSLQRSWGADGHAGLQGEAAAFLFDNNGSLTGTAVIRSVITLDRAATTFTGTQAADVSDNSGHEIDHIEGIVLKGTRVKPDYRKSVGVAARHPHSAGRPLMIS